MLLEKPIYDVVFFTQRAALVAHPRLVQSNKCQLTETWGLVSLWLVAQ